MNTKHDVQEFVSQKTIAMAGLSRDDKSTSANIKKELQAKGYRILGVNPNASVIGGETCYPSLSALPEKVGGVLVVTPSSQSEKVVHEAAAQGISRVWIQLGAHSDAAAAACTQHGLSAVSGKCIMMFAEPVTSIHGVHRWFAKTFGTLPK
jgi:predicted CoA-binding protein